MTTNADVDEPPGLTHVVGHVIMDAINAGFSFSAGASLDEPPPKGRNFS